MKYRNLLILLVTASLLGACSTSKSAEKSNATSTTKQAQTEEPAKETSEEKDAEKAAKEDETKKDKQQDDGQAGNDTKKEKMAGMCPMKVDGTKATVKKLEDAIAMDFTTPGDVDELRERIKKMAAMHNKRHAEGGMKKGKMKGKKGKGKKGKGKAHGEKHKEMMKLMAGTTAETEEIDGGIRMKIVPKNADQLSKLHEHVQGHSKMIAEGNGCPMKMLKGKKAKAN